MRSLLVLFLMLFVGCATSPSKSLTQLKPPLSTLGSNIKLRQKLSIKSEKVNRSIEVVLSKSKSSLQIIGLTTMGAMLFSMNYNGSRIEVSNAKMKDLAELILSDVFIANMAVDQLKKFLPKSYLISEVGNKREIVYEDHVLVQVIYKKRGAWAVEVKIVRPKQMYEITIQTLEKL